MHGFPFCEIDDDDECFVWLLCLCVCVFFSMLRERGRTSKMRATSSFSVRGVNSLVQVGPGHLQFFKYGGRVFAVSSTCIS